MKVIKRYVADILDEWQKIRIPQLAALITYFTIFSLPPLLVLAITIAALVFGRTPAEGRLVSAITQLFGAEAGGLIFRVILNTYEQRPDLFTSLVGTLLFVYSASGAFSALQRALNQIYRHEESPEGGILHVIRGRVLSIGMAILTGILLLVSLVFSAALTALSQVVGGFIPLDILNLQITHELVAFLIISLAFTTLYKVLPHSSPTWRDTMIGGIFAGLLFSLGKFLVSLYLGSSQLPSLYGAAGGVMLLLLWLYYSAQIFLLGAIVSKVKRKIRENTHVEER